MYNIYIYIYLQIRSNKKPPHTHTHKGQVSGSANSRHDGFSGFVLANHNITSAST